VPLTVSRPLQSLPVPAPAPFTLRLDVAGGRLEVAGELDHHTAPLVNDAIAVLAHAGTESWVLDVSGLSGHDSDCLRAISSAYRRALRTGRRMTLVGAPPSLRRALCRLRLDAHLMPARTDLPPGA
jgi:anti-anti-sigma factor